MRSPYNAISAMLLTMAHELSATAAQVAGHGARQPDTRDLLTRIATEELEAATNRKLVAPKLVGDPAWAILLDLYLARAAGREMRTSSLYGTSGVPDTTALRYIGWLENQGLVLREKSDEDHRVTMVTLTDAAVEAIEAYLGQRLACLLALADPGAGEPPVVQPGD